MSFHLNKYQVIKKAISYDLANFIFNYFLLKRDAVKFMYQNNLVPEHSLFGTWKDQQVPNVYSHYADFAMETLLMKVMPVMVKETSLNLIPTYSYARVYEKGSILKRHKDRPSCEISTLVYSGCELEHWREEFTGNICAQVFLHYNHLNGQFANENLYDKRPLLGIPPLRK